MMYSRDDVSLVMRDDVSLVMYVNHQNSEINYSSVTTFKFETCH